MDSGLLAPPGLDSGLLAPPGLDSGFLAPPRLDSGLLAPPGLDSGLRENHHPTNNSSPLECSKVVIQSSLSLKLLITEQLNSYLGSTLV